MNRQLTVALVAVVGLVAVAGGAVLFTGQNGGADATAANDAAAAVERSTPTSQPTASTDRPTETDAVTTTAAPTESAADDSDGESVERANEPPTADAGENVTTREWVRTTLDASASADPDGDDANLSYEWTQVAGDEVELFDANTATPEFFAPESKLKTELTFEVTVTDEDGATATDTVTVFVEESRDSGDRTTENDSADGNETDVEDAPDDGTDDAGETNDSAPAETTTDDVARAKFGSDYDDLNAEDAATVLELTLRHPDGDWDPDSVRTRDELARERYGEEFENLGFDARVDVQESFDAQFGDTGGALTKDEISQAKWDRDFENLSVDSAGQITELYDRQPWINEDNKHMPTRNQLAYRVYDATLDELTREQRLDVERRYHAQFETE